MTPQPKPNFILLPFNPLLAHDFAELTYPIYRLKLASDAVHAVAARDIEGQPAGLVMAEPDPQPGEIRLCSLFVDAPFRRYGLGGRLMAALEERLRSRAVKTITAIYMTGTPFIDFMEHIFRQQGWAPPVPRMRVLRTDQSRIRSAPWFRDDPLPPGVELFPWVQLSPADRQALLTPTSRWWPDDLSPFTHELESDPEVSMGLRYRGQVAGWALTHRMEKDLVRFSSVYVRPDLQALGLMLPLIIACSRQMQDAGLERAMWTVPFHHPRMLAFMDQWFKPYCSFCGETRGSEKRLAPGGGQSSAPGHSRVGIAPL